NHCSHRTYIFCALYSLIYYHYDATYIYLCFFFLLLPPPPISTLFPYTTLFRSPDNPWRSAPPRRQVQRIGYTNLERLLPRLPRLDTPVEILPIPCRVQWRRLHPSWRG